MNSPACCLNKVERVGRIVDILKNETFCGFPVVNAKGLVCFFRRFTCDVSETVLQMLFAKLIYSRSLEGH